MPVTFKKTLVILSCGQEITDRKFGKSNEEWIIHFLTFLKEFSCYQKTLWQIIWICLTEMNAYKKHTMFYSKTIVNAKYIQYILIWLENSEPCNVYFQKKTSIQRFECFIKAVNFVNGDDNLTQWTRKRLIDFKLLCTRATLIWNSRTSVLTVSVRKLLVQAHFIPSFGHRK